MKATGIIRRVDDLGRIVIPKEIRQTLHIKEGDPMEIYVDDGCVIFKRYSYFNSTGDRVRIANSMARRAELHPVGIYDNEHKISGSDASFPQDVPRPWMVLSYPATFDKLTVYPIMTNGTRHGYLVTTNGQTTEAAMICTYLAASFEH